MKTVNTFGNYKFDEWVCEDVRKQIRNFWGCFGRNYKDWLKNFENEKKEFPKYGENVTVLKRKEVLGHTLYEKYEGRFIFAWNNIGRIIDKNGKIGYVSTCDTFYSLRNK